MAITDRATSSWRRMLVITVRSAIPIALVGQLLLFEIAVLTRSRFTSTVGGALVLAIVGLLVYGAALNVLKGGRLSRNRYASVFWIAGALALTVRQYLPEFLTERYRRELAAETSPPLVAFLRSMSAAQEQYRLRRGSYATSLNKLRPLTAPAASLSVRLRANGAEGWSAHVTQGDRSCFLWVRDSMLRTEVAQPEGSPVCGVERRGKHQSVHTVIVAPARERPFVKADLGGQWLQHRGDAHRSGITPSSDTLAAGVRWSAVASGELRASAAVAGNQVFVGAHGNGEFVALSLDSGLVGFRSRVPNWVHHEPVVTSGLVIVAFGNNEPPYLGALESGSAPSGVVAFDRRTGIERWRAYSRGAVMASPIVRDSIVAAVTFGSDAIAWRVRDGAELWRTRLPGASPMGNPLVTDSMLIVGLELTQLCALHFRTGAILYCRAMAQHGWGAGHASPATDGVLVLQAYERVTRTSKPLKRRTRIILKKIVGLTNPPSYNPGTDEVGDQELVASRIADGAEQWRVVLGRGDRPAVGHIAGTPVIENGVAYVPSPNNGRIFAIRTDSGRILWSTDINTSRGSVLVTQGAVLAATADGRFVVLDAATGQVRCEQKLPGTSDRAGPTLAGKTGILTLRNGMILARPIADWLACRA